MCLNTQKHPSPHPTFVGVAMAIPCRIRLLSFLRGAHGVKSFSKASTTTSSSSSGNDVDCDRLACPGSVCHWQERVQGVATATLGKTALGMQQALGATTLSAAAACLAPAAPSSAGSLTSIAGPKTAAAAFALAFGLPFSLSLPISFTAATRSLSSFAFSH